MKLTVEIPAAVVHQARAVAAERGQPLKQMIADLLRQASPKNGRKAGTPLQRKPTSARATHSSAADGWLEQWRALGLVISARAKGRTSAAETISRMRR